MKKIFVEPSSRVLDLSQYKINGPPKGSIYCIKKTTGYAGSSIKAFWRS